LKKTRLCPEKVDLDKTRGEKVNRLSRGCWPGFSESSSPRGLLVKGTQSKRKRGRQLIGVMVKKKLLRPRLAEGESVPLERRSSKVSH